MSFTLISSVDECDRMVDLGFEVDLNIILDAMPSASDGEAADGGTSRVTHLFSATMPPEVERISRKYLRKPAYVTIGLVGEAVDTVEQRVEFISSDAKKAARLTEILRNGGFAAPIVSVPSISYHRSFSADYCIDRLRQSEENSRPGNQARLRGWTVRYHALLR